MLNTVIKTKDSCSILVALPASLPMGTKMFQKIRALLKKTFPASIPGCVKYVPTGNKN